MMADIGKLYCRSNKVCITPLQPNSSSPPYINVARRKTKGIKCIFKAKLSSLEDKPIVSISKAENKNRQFNDFFLCSKIDFTTDLIVLSSSNTNNAAISGTNPPIMCRIVPRGWENEITLRLVNTASPHHAIHEIRNVIIRNFASLSVFNLVYPPSQLLRPQPISQLLCLALFFPGLYFFALYFSDLDIKTTHSTCMVLGKLSTGRTRISS